MSGSRPTPFLTVEKAVEFIMLIPGSELSASRRREVARTLVRTAGGDVSLIATIEKNRRLQEFLKEHDPNHPLRAAGEFVDRRDERLEGATVEHLCDLIIRDMRLTRLRLPRLPLFRDLLAPTALALGPREIGEA